MAEQFSVSQLQDEVSMYDEFVEIDFTSQGKEYTIKLFPFFKPEKIRDLVNEMIEFFKAAEKEKVEVKQIEEDDLVGYYILKYFTDMKFTKSKKAKNIYAEFKFALNSPLFKQLMEAYPKESVKTVIDRIYEVSNASIKIKNDIEEAQGKIKDLPLENREIIEKLGNKLK